jgi:hypothetical protein
MYSERCFPLVFQSHWLGRAIDPKRLQPLRRKGSEKHDNSLHCLDRQMNIIANGLLQNVGGSLLLLQSFFVRGNREFSSREVLLSGAVLTDRSGNELVVNRLKYSNIMIFRGIHHTQDLPWCNFMQLGCYRQAQSDHSFFAHHGSAFASVAS